MTLQPQKYAYAATDHARSHTAHVVRKIGMDIVSGNYPEQSILPGDADLMQQFGVSRTVLREALRALAAKGLIQPKARIGTRVRDKAHWNLFDPDVLIWHAEAGFDAKFLEYLGEMRLALELEAAALAARRRTPLQVQHLYGWVEKMGADGVSPDAFVEADFNFHLTVAVAAGNPFLRSISTLIEVALVALLTVSSPLEDPVRHARSVADHRAIADAIARRDAELARRAMRVVIEEGNARSRAARA
ncbi:MAG TPA: FadR family transcriptional regulator [Alphaproteobacteria bacterium]|nr:FadR family transcriptional regulator [Alphaproteobacteria bacterium]